MNTPELDIILSNRQACGHSFWQNGDFKCDNMINLIEKYHNNKIKLSDKTAMAFMEFLFNKSYPSIKNCARENSGKLIPVISQLFTYYLPDIKILSSFFEIPEYDICYSYLETNPKFNSKHAILSPILSRLRFSCNSEDNKLIDFLFRNINMDLNTIKSLVACRNNYLSLLLSGILDKFNEDIPKEILYIACEYLPYTKPIIESLKNRGLNIDSVCLEMACKTPDLEGLKYILSHNLTIQKNHFQNLILSRVFEKFPTQPGAKKIYSYWNNSPGEWLPGYTPEKMELLIQSGYKITKDDLIYSIQNRKEIPNLDRFDLDLNQEILELCWLSDFYPNYNFTCISPKMVELQKLCREKKPSQIKKFFSENKLIPDNKTMENACGFRTNLPILNILIQQGGKINFSCLKKCAREMRENNFLIKLMEYYEADLNKNQEKIKKLESEIIKLGGKLDQPETKPNNILKNIIKQKNLDIPAEIPAENPPEDFELINLDITQDQISEIQKKNRTKSEIPKKFIDIFKYKNPGINKISYSEIKKILIGNIQANSWINTKNKNLIDLPANIRKKLKLKSGYIPFDDIDKLTCIFYIN